MAGVATPSRAEVAATIEVGPAPGYPVAFHAVDPTSANYLVNGNGDWDFSSLKGPVMVRLTIATPGVVFYRGGGESALSFADDPARAKQRVAPGHHQFPADVQHVGGQSLSFTYRNAWDDGVGDGVKRRETSAYGLYFGDAAGALLLHHDPVISNGGTTD
jgi:hypothetical protein